jgi:hypothetical protein
LDKKSFIAMVLGSVWILVGIFGQSA